MVVFGVWTDKVGKLVAHLVGNKEEIEVGNEVENEVGKVVLL